MRPGVRFAKGVIGFGAPRLASTGAMFLLMVVLARIGTPEQLGTISFVLAASTILLTVADLGMSQALQKFVQEFGESVIRPAFLVKLATATALGGIVWALDLAFGVFKGAGGWIGGITAASAFQVVFLAENARMRFRWAGIYQIACTLLFFVLAVGLALAWDPVDGPLAARAASFALLGIPLASWPFVRRGPLSIPGLGRVLRFGLLATVNSVFTVIFYRSDILLLTYLSGYAAAGSFRVAHTLADVPMLIQPVVSLPLMPILAEQLRAGNAADLARFRRLVTASVLALLGPILIGGLVFARPLVTLFFGDAYAGAVPAFALLLVSSALQIGIVAHAYVFYMSGRLPLLCVISGTEAAVNVAANLVLIPRYGITGAAAASLATLAVGTLLLLCLYYRAERPAAPTAAAARFAVALAVTTVAALGLRRLATGLVPMLGCLAAVCAVYAAALLALRVVPHQRIRALLAEAVTRKPGTAA
jgi:O-antigen/teichoic acid export membrane protein